MMNYNCDMDAPLLILMGQSNARLQNISGNKLMKAVNAYE